VVVFDEGVLTGKYTKDSTFPPDDFRSAYFAGDRLERAVARTEKIREELEGTEHTLPLESLERAFAERGSPVLLYTRAVLVREA
jgi:hypothetical protein